MEEDELPEFSRDEGYIALYRARRKNGSEYVGAVVFQARTNERGVKVFPQAETLEVVCTFRTFPGQTAAKTFGLSFRLSTNVHLPNDHQETIQ